MIVRVVGTAVAKKITRHSQQFGQLNPKRNLHNSIPNTIISIINIITINNSTRTISNTFITITINQWMEVRGVVPPLRTLSSNPNSNLLTLEPLICDVVTIP